MERTYHVKRINDIGSFDVERNICQEYAVIHEIETEWNTMVCGGNTRVQHIYLSKSNALRIEITNSAQRHFMLRYEGKFISPGLLIDRIIKLLNPMFY